ncbi:MAG: hypothetical protein R3B89_12645 [Polyangiaceae bacterium]
MSPWSSRVVALASLSVLSLVGCDDDAASPPLAMAAVNSNTRVEELTQLTERVAFKRHELESREHVSWELPSKPRDRACPRLAKGETEADQLILLARDARVDSRKLLPLRLTRQLTSRDFDALEPHYAADSKAGAKRRVRSKRDGELALEKLDRIGRRRFAAVFHVTHYVEPHFFHDPKKRKPEWGAGWMMGWIAIHELGEPEALCQWSIDVRSDTSNASLARRLRETTRHELTSDLGKRFREAGMRALRQLESGLSKPER